MTKKRKIIYITIAAAIVIIAALAINNLHAENRTADSDRNAVYGSKVSC